MSNQVHCSAVVYSSRGKVTAAAYCMHSIVDVCNDAKLGYSGFYSGRLGAIDVRNGISLQPSKRRIEFRNDKKLLYQRTMCGGVATWLSCNDRRLLYSRYTRHALDGSSKGLS